MPALPNRRANKAILAAQTVEWAALHYGEGLSIRQIAHETDKCQQVDGAPSGAGVAVHASDCSSLSGVWPGAVRHVAAAGCCGSDPSGRTDALRLRGAPDDEQSQPRHLTSPGILLIHLLTI